jgi:hypothetical protein
VYLTYVKVKDGSALMGMPLLTVGHVLNHAPDGHGVQVMLKSGESPMLPVLVGTHGPNDGLRVNQMELPGRGTWGLIAFPHGDARNGIWICSYNTNALDAFSSGPSDTAMRYRSHFSGHWDMLDNAGNAAEVWPDGSSMVVGNGGAVPTAYRHTVDATGARQRTVLTHAQRVAAPPAPMPRVFTHASGATASIDPTGLWTITTTGFTLTIAPGGTTTLVQSGELAATYHHATLNGDIVLTGNMTTTGNVVVGAGASGSFSTPTGQTVTVQAGIITNIN